MLNIGKIGDYVVIQITNDQGAVTAEVNMTPDTAHFVAKRIAEEAKELEKRHGEAKPKSKKK